MLALPCRLKRKISNWSPIQLAQSLVKQDPHPPPPPPLPHPPPRRSFQAKATAEIIDPIAVIVQIIITRSPVIMRGATRSHAEEMIVIANTIAAMGNAVVSIATREGTLKALCP